MLITKTIEIDMGHRVPNHKSKCRNLHGHRYKIEVGVDDKVIDEKGVSSEGMVIDYGDLKEMMIDGIDFLFDHGFVVHKEDKELLDFFLVIPGVDAEFVGFDLPPIKNDWKIVVVRDIPTAENLAKLWFNILKEKLFNVDIKIKHVKVWETPTSTAEYEE